MNYNSIHVPLLLHFSSSLPKLPTVCVCYSQEYREIVYSNISFSTIVHSLILPGSLHQLHLEVLVADLP
jgi:hypothetical protein